MSRKNSFTFVFLLLSAFVAVCQASFLPSTEQVAIQHVSYLKIYGPYPCVESSVRIEDFMREDPLSTGRLGLGWRRLFS
jgi:hypothetical protein